MAARPALVRVGSGQPSRSRVLSVTLTIFPCLDTDSRCVRPGVFSSSRISSRLSPDVGQSSIRTRTSPSSMPASFAGDGQHRLARKPAKTTDAPRAG